MNIPRRFALPAKFWIFAALLALAPAGTTFGDQVDYGIALKRAAESDQWHQVSFREAFLAAPVVLVNNQGGEVNAEAVEIRNVGGSGFEYRFTFSQPQADPAKWVGIAYLAAAAGEYEFGGLHWKAGVVTVSTSTLQIAFATPFDSVPFAMARANVGSGVDVSLSQVGSSQIEFLLGFAPPPPPATFDVPFIAVETGTGSAAGRAIEVARFAHPSDGASTAFTVACAQPVVFAATQTNVSPSRLRCEVGRADPLGFDSSLRHYDPGAAPPAVPEQVGFIAMGRGLSQGTEPDTKLEIGELTVIPGAPADWVSITFSASYRDPVVIVSPVSLDEPFPLSLSAPSSLHVRIRNLTATGCEVLVAEPGASDTEIESVYWMVMESGSFTVGGRQWEAGTVILGGDGADGATFSAVFATPPVLLAQVASSGNADPARVQPVEIAIDGLLLALAGTPEPGLQSEVVHYLAVEPGKGDMSPGTGLKFEAKTVAPTRLKWSAWSRLRFDETYAAPFFFAHVQDDSDGLPPDLRHRNLAERKVDISVNEDLVDNTPRRIGLLLFGDTKDRDGDGMPDAWEVKYVSTPIPPVI